MPTPDFSSVAWWISQLGFPGVLCFMAWRILVFLKPYAMDLIPTLKATIEKHNKLVDTLESNVVSVADSIKVLGQKQEEHGHMLKDIHDKLTQ